MSIALDVALYLRENNIIVSLSARGVLFTLFFRVGSNPFTWVTQEDLAIECGVTERQLRTQTRILEKLGLIIIKRDPKDKRRNLYCPAEFLINYHQKPNREGDKKYRKKTSSNFKNTGRILPINTGRKHPVNKNTIYHQPIENIKEKSTYIPPKAKEESKSVLKQKRDLSVDNFKNDNKRHHSSVGLTHIKNILKELKMGGNSQ